MVCRIALNCFLSPGDAVVLTTVLRDIHNSYPGMFEIVPVVCTYALPLFKHNPYIYKGRYTSELIKGCEPIAISKHLLDYFCSSHLHKQHFIECVNEIVSKQIGLPIKISALKGEIYLGESEKKRGKLPPRYWAITSGGKLDITVKFYPHYQKVVDILKGKVTFVQFGRKTDFGPALQGAIDFRDRTRDIRELASLIYNCDGVLSPVSLPVHLAATFDKPAVVLAGGYEEISWIQYKNHKVISQIGTLPCCLKQACYKQFAKKVDKPLNLGQPCDDVITHDNESYARCMLQTSPEEIADHILNINVG